MLLRVDMPALGPLAHAVQGMTSIRAFHHQLPYPLDSTTFPSQTFPAFGSDRKGGCNHCIGGGWKGGVD
jgi:hypothetical protein